jgi:hypothetical protein
MPETVSLPKKEYEAMKKDIKYLKETLEVVMDRELMESTRRGLKDLKEGRTISHEELKKRFAD